MRVSLVELGVYAPPRGMEGWRCFRIEYGGYAESCLVEGLLWIPGMLSANAEVTHWDGCYLVHPWCDVMRAFQRLEDLP